MAVVAPGCGTSTREVVAVNDGEALLDEATRRVRAEHAEHAGHHSREALEQGALERLREIVGAGARAGAVA